MSIGNIVKHVNVPFETIVSVALWDLPGREEMDLRRSYYKDVDAAIGKKYKRHNILLGVSICTFFLINRELLIHAIEE